MNKRHLFIFLAFSTVLFGCQQASNNASEQITFAQDYEVYLSGDHQLKAQQIEEEINFWQAKLDANPSNLVAMAKIANQLRSKFELDANVDHLNNAYQLLVNADSIAMGKQIGNLQALASLSIMRHQFKEAEYYARKAVAHGQNQWASKLLLYDALMEVGNPTEAGETLMQLDNQQKFAFQVRLAKWHDHIGQLDSSIAIMERQLANLDYEDKNYLWTKTNLAEMYGHNGEIQKSYQSFLATLQIDPQYDYALKGIAWIAFSHDKNYKEAARILNQLYKRHPSPEYQKLLSDIYKMDQQPTLAMKAKDIYVNKVSKPTYHGMYNLPLAEHYIDNNQVQKAALLIDAELQNRATPLVYAFKGLTLAMANNSTDASSMLADKVLDKTFEPLPNYLLGRAYAALGDHKADQLLNEAKEASFELGLIRAQIATNVLMN